MKERGPIVLVFAVLLKIPFPLHIESTKERSNL